MCAPNSAAPQRGPLPLANGNRALGAASLAIIRVRGSAPAPMSEPVEGLIRCGVFCGRGRWQVSRRVMTMTIDHWTGGANGHQGSPSGRCSVPIGELDGGLSPRAGSRVSRLAEVRHDLLAEGTTGFSRVLGIGGGIYRRARGESPANQAGGARSGPSARIPAQDLPASRARCPAAAAADLRWTPGRPAGGSLRRRSGPALPGMSPRSAL